MNCYRASSVYQCLAPTPTCKSIFSQRDKQIGIAVDKYGTRLSIVWSVHRFGVLVVELKVICSQYATLIAILECIYSLILHYEYNAWQNVGSKATPQ